MPHFPMPRPLPAQVSKTSGDLELAWRCLQGTIAILPFSPLLAALLALIMAIQVGRKQGQRIAEQPLNWGFLILGFGLLISAVFAENRQAAFLGLFNFFPFFILFVFTNALIRTPAQLRRLAFILVTASILVIVLGLGQLILGWKGSFQILWIVFDLRLAAEGFPIGRMASILDYANILASYLIITFTFAIGLAVSSLHKPVKFNQARIYILILGIALSLNGLALILTHSRNAWAIALLTVLVFAVYLGWRWLWVGVGVIAGLILGSAFGFEPLRTPLRKIVPAYFWARLTDEMFPNRPLAQLRSTQWQFAWNMTLERPITGWGLRNFTPLYEEKMNYWLGHPHNIFLMLSSETGIINTLLFVGLVGWIIVQGFYSYRQSLLPPQDRILILTYLLAFLASTSFHCLDITFFDSRINLLNWVILAAICGVADQSRLTRYSV